MTDTEGYSLFYAILPPKGEKRIGKGEAVIALAKAYDGILASNNLRGISKYVKKYNLEHIATGDILVSALKADFIDFNLMLEGVGIMRKILSPAMNGYAKMRKSGFSSEIDTIQVAKGLDLQLMKNPTWTPGKQSMSVKDHMDVIQRLKEKEIVLQEVAATIDKV